MESEMTCNVSEMWSPKMPHGLDFEITEHPLTMRRVVNLIIAMERFKGSNASETTQGTEFRDENLLNIILENLVEERYVFGCESNPPVQIIKTDGYPCKVTDGEKRSLIRIPNSMQLHAVMLQGGVEPATKVHLNLSSYAHPAATVEGRTIALGIRGSDLYLCCRKDGAEPTLHLEAVTDDSSLASMSSDSDKVRFLFYEQVTGVNITTLMSVAFPDWYISTAEQNNKPLEMCLETAQRSRIFNIQEIKSESA
ncbi:interleukin-1 beta-like [Centropristis striata]|uniref:interleukin-1 beta-like n=1 Tax=Centropristis striata TaxID=184440 RepID=UPI0027DF5C4C|nr:interleukin-1 beta-like [Centropristis striata]